MSAPPGLCRRATSCAWRPRLRGLLDRRSVCRCGLAEVRSGGHPWVRLAAQTVAKRRAVGPRRGGWAGGRGAGGAVERWGSGAVGRRGGGRRAPNVTYNAVWETSVPKVVEILVYFEHRVEMPKSVRKRSAPNVTHSAISWT